MINAGTDLLPHPEERRREPRHPFPAQICIGKSCASKFKALDLSSFGIGFVSSEPFVPNTHIEVVFLNKNVMTKAVIRHCTRVNHRDYIVGVMFEKEERDLVDVLLLAVQAGLN